ncbi:MAG: ammonia-forming cytochrome c nitrite reductase subunit c552 [Planctomycetes bacterium]|nr:ammonia-forming cytochrome c nitrite reductase subunit c552 [Planctomycetota bacterium]
MHSAHAFSRAARLRGSAGATALRRKAALILNDRRRARSRWRPRHPVRSPLRNVNHACPTCHRWLEEELKARVDTIQTPTFDMRNLAMDALVDSIADIEAAGKTDEQLAKPRDFQHRSQFYVDFIEAENSTGIHAPQEAARILAESIDFSQKCQVALRPAT